MQFVFVKEGGSSESVSFVDGAPSSCSGGGVINYGEPCPGSEPLTIPQVGESRSYLYSPKTGVQGYVLVNPVLDSGRICDTSDRIKLSLCPS